ncbi:hypothetical protein P280DRAFT_498990 [Massarina eburnea CBS 473.64]|uniref:Transcription factor IIIC putative zinc-finger domain-containing protein n=1 Tax=Massarina eburnea CBS 473.64 TaxID=1395130 RepID=A0A6A6S1Y2_9PLEO|nr:hypothetical protein P280DRAFT_498990 [Massarina eburnea CBS 473.64]
MSDVTDLKVWPCTFEAIDWSHDGIIALAAEESVELLFPNADFNDTEQKDVSWQHISLQSTWFTTDELPDKEPAPIPTYSIGEEISTSVPTSVAWSPPGLAKHRRCALGVLSSSLVFSLWASDGKPHEMNSWGRRLILNHVLAEYFIPKDNDGNGAAAEESDLVSQNAEKARLRTRVRAFAWAHNLPADHSSIVGTQVKWGQYIVAIANDDNQIVFMIVDSPTSTFGAEEDWNADVLDHFTVTPDSENIFSAPRTFDNVMKQQRHVSHIAWSPWTVRGEWYHSVLVYATNDDVRARLITYKHDTIGLGDEIVYPNINLRHKGPIKWSSRVRDGDRFELALFGTNGLTILTISATYATILERKEHDLDDRWDEISGVAWDQSNPDISHLHFSSSSSTMTHPTAAVSLSPEGLTVLPSPNWREHIGDTQALFSAQNDLKGNVKSKVWGLCASPLGDFIAACHTVHPSDMLEYGPPKERRCTIAVDNFESYSQNATINFPRGDVSAEGIAFTLRKWVENKVEASDQMEAFQEQVLGNMIKIYGTKEDVQGSISISDSYTSQSLSELTAEFKRNVFLNPNTIKDRYTLLTSRICSPKDPLPALQKTLIAYRLATATITLPPSFSHASAFSAEILYSHHQLVALVDTVMHPNRESSSSYMPPNNGAVIDTCDFCNAVIPFRDLDTAICTNGHAFSRCGLSFLAIQAPRITKTCGVCGTAVMGEEWVAAQENNASPVGGKGGSKGTGMENGSGDKVMENGDGDNDKRQMNGASNRGENEEVVETTELHDVEMVDVRDNTQNDGKQVSEMPVSLARLLFLSCDACIYCGGKYSG